MSTLNEFIASVKTEGLMTSNRFSVELTVPPILLDSNFTDLSRVLLHCENITLPGLSLSTTQSRTFGEYREMPYEKTFDTIAMTFFVDNTMQVKQLFDVWINDSIQNSSSKKFNYYTQYTTQMSINVYDKNENQRYIVRLYECYPKVVSAITLDYNSKDVMRLQVSMNYKYWESNVMDVMAVSDVNGQGNYTMPNEVPDTYYTNFNQYQAGYSSFENSRTSLYAAETQSIGLGSIFT